MIEYYSQKNAPEFEKSFILDLFPRGDVSIIGSKPGVGKTWLMLHCCLLASRDDVNVIYFCGETSRELIYNRLNSLCTPLNETERSNFYLHFNDILEPSSGFVSFDNLQGFNNLVRLIEITGAEFLVFDSFLSFHTRDESKATEMNEIFQNLIGIAKRYNVAIVLTHHLRKSQQKKTDITQDEIIGSSVITRLCACCFTLIKSRDGTLLKCVKTWYEEPPLMKFVLKSDGDAGLLPEFEPFFKINYDMFCAVVRTFSRFDYGMLSHEFPACPRSTMYRYIAKAEKDGVIVSIKEGTAKYYKTVRS